ncbi:hypothetical protein EMIT053CA3_160006 [Pseudomonas donghuensis]
MANLRDDLRACRSRQSESSVRKTLRVPTRFSGYRLYFMRNIPILPLDLRYILSNI